MLTDMAALQARLEHARNTMDDAMVETFLAGGLTPEHALHMAVVFLVTGERLVVCGEPL